MAVLENKVILKVSIKEFCQKIADEVQNINEVV